MRIYLAGKIARDDWRRSILGDRPGALQREDWTEWPVLARGIYGVHDYMGPFFVSCDHGCYHGSNTHAAGIGGSGCCGDGADRDITRERVFSECYSAIRRSQLLFVWLDSADAHGTLVEIGIARALLVPVAIAWPRGFDTSDLWFAKQAATWTLPSYASPDAALREAIKRAQTWHGFVR